MRCPLLTYILFFYMVVMIELGIVRGREGRQWRIIRSCLCKCVSLVSLSRQKVNILLHKSMTPRQKIRKSSSVQGWQRCETRGRVAGRGSWYREGRVGRFRGWLARGGPVPLTNSQGHIGEGLWGRRRREEKKVLRATEGHARTSHRSVSCSQECG